MAKHGKRNQKIKRVKAIRQNRMYLVRKKAGKKTCALCDAVLHGAPHGKRVAGIAKLSRSQRRPTGLFGGILCSRCRENALEEAIRVRVGAKQLDDVGLAEKNFVEQALQHLNKMEK